MEMINKNVSMDFEALKKHARMNYWHIDEVNFFAILKFIFISFELLIQQLKVKYLLLFVINFCAQLFMFFSQQGVTNDSFPCNTVAGSRIGGNSKDRQRSSLCHEYHLFCVRQKELYKVAPAPFLLSTWGSTTPSVAV